MAKISWLMAVLLVHGGCNPDGESTESGPCFYVPKAEVPRADYDAANADDELSSDECDALCRDNIDEQKFDDHAQGLPECFAEEVGVSVVTLQCRWKIGCA